MSIRPTSRISSRASAPTRWRCSRQCPISTTCSCRSAAAAAPRAAASFAAAWRRRRRSSACRRRAPTRSHGHGEDRHARDRRAREHVCRRDGDARHLRSDVRHPEGTCSTTSSSSTSRSSKKACAPPCALRTTWRKEPARRRSPRRRNTVEARRQEIGCVMSGGNIDTRTLARCLDIQSARTKP